MADDNAFQRSANQNDRPCNVCGTPMIGIMKVSDLSHSGSPRIACVDCGGNCAGDIAKKIKS